MENLTNQFNNYMKDRIAPENLPKEGKILLLCCNEKEIGQRIQNVFEKMGFHVFVLENFTKKQICVAFDFMIYLPKTWKIVVYFYADTLNEADQTWIKMTNYQPSKLISTTYGIHSLKCLADSVSVKDIVFYIDTDIHEIESYMECILYKNPKTPPKIYMNKKGQLLQCIEKLQDYRIDSLVPLGVKTLL